MILSSITSVKVLTYAILGVWTTIWTTYGCAVYTGAVPPPFSTGTFHWPMISDTWAVVPGSYISRFAMPPFMIAWAMFCWSVSDWLDTFSQTRYEKFRSTVLRYLIQIGCAGFLACVAVNEDENNTVHSVGALTFFASQALYCTNVVYHHYRLYLLLVLLTYWGVLGVFVIYPLDRVELAVCEWLAVGVISAFHWSLRRDLGDSVIFSISNPTSYITLDNSSVGDCL